MTTLSLTENGQSHEAGDCTIQNNQWGNTDGISFSSISGVTSGTIDFPPVLQYRKWLGYVRATGTLFGIQIGTKTSQGAKQ